MLLFFFVDGSAHDSYHPHLCGCYILLAYRKYIVPLGVFDCFAAGQECLSQIHQVDQLGKGHIQACGLKGRVSIMGQTQKQTRHEL